MTAGTVAAALTLALAGPAPVDLSWDAPEACARTIPQVLEQQSGDESARRVRATLRIVPDGEDYRASVTVEDRSGPPAHFELRAATCEEAARMAVGTVMGTIQARADVPRARPSMYARRARAGYLAAMVVGATISLGGAVGVSIGGWDPLFAVAGAPAVGLGLGVGTPMAYAHGRWRAAGAPEWAQWRGRRLKRDGLIVLGAGAGLAAVGLGMYLRNPPRSLALATGPVDPDDPAWYEPDPVDPVTAWGGIILAVGAGVLTAGSFVAAHGHGLQKGPPKRQYAVAPLWLPGGAGVGMRGRF